MTTDSLALSQLPATFFDAVEMTRALGYEHLWIDALCIVQDNKEDWQKEAPRMAVIYGNAVRTLHVLDSGSADGGFLPGQEATSGVLDTRAWTTQEMAISPWFLLLAGLAPCGSVARKTTLFGFYFCQHCHCLMGRTIPAI